MGVTDLLKFNLWTIESVDDEVLLKLEGHFRPDRGIDSDQRPILDSAVTAGSSEPSVQWVAGGSRVLRFTSSFVAKTFLHDIRPEIDKLRSLRQKDPTLGRAPRISLSWGEEELTGFVSQLSDTVTDLWATGLPKRCDFTLEVTGAPDVTDTSESGETQFIRLAAGELFETLGLRYLGNPIRGELIRRINPKLAGAPEVAGSIVKVFEKEHPAMRGSVVPRSPPFLGDSWAAEVDELGASRGREERGLSWENLPEVVGGLF